MNKSDIKALLELPFHELVYQAGQVKKEFSSSKLDLCTIMNARSGMCPEDCKFCAQSSHHSTGMATYPLASNEEILQAAKKAKEIGSQRFGIVTSGNALTSAEITRIAEIIPRIRKEIGIEVCASLGKLDEASLRLFKAAGLVRYHHNIETSRHFYPNIVSTHTFDERLETILNAKKAGVAVCSGGIIGLGETWDDRIDMLLTLKELNVDSIPINILIPIKGTAMESAPPISAVDAIKTIAIFRIVLKDKVIKVAAGRETVLKDYQGMAFMAGANGMLIGGYLTIKGRDIQDDWKLIENILNN